MPFIGSVFVALLFEFTLVEYLIVCLPTFISIWEPVSLGTWYTRSITEGPAVISVYSEEKGMVNSQCELEVQGFGKFGGLQRDARRKEGGD